MCTFLSVNILSLFNTYFCLTLNSTPPNRLQMSPFFGNLLVYEHQLCEKKLWFRLPIMCGNSKVMFRCQTKTSAITPKYSQATIHPL